MKSVEELAQRAIANSTDTVGVVYALLTIAAAIREASYVEDQASDRA